MKTSQAAALVAQCISRRLPVLLVGQPGVGKTDIITAAAEAAGMNLIVSHPVVSGPEDFKGMPAVIGTPDGPAAEWLPFGDLRQLLTATAPTVAFLDDLGQASPAVQAAAMQLLLARRIGEHRVSDAVTFAAATNRRADRAAVSGILEPVKSRFAAIITVEADLDDWTLWALSHGIPSEMVAFIRFRPQHLTEYQPSAEIAPSVTPRTLAVAAAFLAADFPADLRPAALSAALGEGVAAELTGFLRYWQELPPIDSIFSTPATAPVPKEPAALYAVSAAVARRMTPTNIDRAMAYIGRLPEEFGVLAARDAVALTPALATTSALQQWYAQHAEAYL